MLQNKTVRFIVAGVLLLGALWVVGNRRQVPPLPRDEVHAGAAANGDCTPCHGPAAEAPLSTGHPPKDDCLYCHARG